MENVVKVFNFNDKNYMKIEPQGFITLDIKSTDGDWDKGLLIANNNLYQVVSGFRRMVDNMRDPELYGVTRAGKILLYADKVKGKIVDMSNLGGQQRVVITPTVVVDENDCTYEGCRMVINNAENYVDLPIDALESVYYALSKIDLFAYTSHLYTMYISTISKADLTSVSMPTRSPRKHMLLDNPVEDVVRSNIIVKKDSDSQIFAI
jgi:hypothetical protein